MTQPTPRGTDMIKRLVAWWLADEGGWPTMIAAVFVAGLWFWAITA